MSVRCEKLTKRNPVGNTPIKDTKEKIIIVCVFTLPLINDCLMSHSVYKIINSSKVISFRKGLNILKMPKILSVDEETCLIDEETKFGY